MKERNSHASSLRLRAEAELSRHREGESPLDEADPLRLLRELRVQRHELRVHQIELEMQNDKLRAAQVETEAFLDRYTELFEFAPIGFFQLSTDGTIREANFAGARLLGVERRKLAGRPLVMYVVEGERMAFEGFLASVLSCDVEDTVCEGGEFALKGPDGEIRARVQGALLVDGALRAALLAVEDVTARRAEESLREEARRKDEFLGALSHELRNPLAAIRNALTLVERLPLADGGARPKLQIIDRQVTQLTRLVDDLLDVTRIARGKVRLQTARLDLRELVRGTVEDHRPGFEARRVALRCDLGAAACWVEGDASRLAQVLGNLLGNALKFTSPGGHVEVRLGDRDGSVALSVRDDGVGIAPEVGAHLFEPFSQGPQTLDRSRGGLGLGLATVKGLVELHGGQVSSESGGPDRGATFTVLLPIAETPPRGALDRGGPPGEGKPTSAR